MKATLSKPFKNRGTYYDGQNSKHITSRKDTGIVFLDDPPCAGWNKNLHVARVFARKMQISNLLEQFCFLICIIF